MQELPSLIFRAKQGDLAAYDQIVIRFQDMAVGYAYSVLGDFHWAQDAAQEAFIESFSCLPKLEEPLAFAGWLRRIVFKHCDRILRRKRVLALNLDAAEEIPYLEIQPQQVLEQQEMAAEVVRALISLPEHLRNVTVLFYFGQHSQQQIAEFLGVPLSTVKKRLYSARQKLKQEITAMVEENFKEKNPSKNNGFSEEVARKLRTYVDGHWHFLEEVKVYDFFTGSSTSIALPKPLGEFKDRKELDKAVLAQILQAKELRHESVKNWMTMRGIDNIEIQDAVVAYLESQYEARQPVLLATFDLQFVVNNTDEPAHKLAKAAQSCREAFEILKGERAQTEAQLYEKLTQLAPHHVETIKAMLLVVVCMEDSWMWTLEDSWK